MFSVSLLAVGVGVGCDPDQSRLNVVRNPEEGTPLMVLSGIIDELEGKGRGKFEEGHLHVRGWKGRVQLLTLNFVHRSRDHIVIVSTPIDAQSLKFPCTVCFYALGEDFKHYMLTQNF